MDMSGKQCPCCGVGKLVKETVKMDKFTYNGSSIWFSNSIYYKCPVCKESFCDNDCTKKQEPVLTAFRNMVDGR